MVREVMDQIVCATLPCAGSNEGCLQGGPPPPPPMPPPGDPPIPLQDPPPPYSQGPPVPIPPPLPDQPPAPPADPAQQVGTLHITAMIRKLEDALVFEPSFKLGKICTIALGAIVFWKPQKRHLTDCCALCSGQISRAQSSHRSSMRP